MWWWWCTTAHTSHSPPTENCNFSTPLHSVLYHQSSVIRHAQHFTPLTSNYNITAFRQLIAVAHQYAITYRQTPHSACNSLTDSQKLTARCTLKSLTLSPSDTCTTTPPWCHLFLHCTPLHIPHPHCTLTRHEPNAQCCSPSLIYQLKIATDVICRACDWLGIT